MNGVIVNFRGSKRRKTGNQMVIEVEGVDNKDKAKKLVGKKVSWLAPGKKNTTIKGKVSSAHGNKGAGRALFERGLPGQSLGTKVLIE